MYDCPRGNDRYSVWQRHTDSGADVVGLPEGQ